MTLNKFKIKAKYNVDITRMTIIEYLLFVEDITPKIGFDNEEE